MHRNGTIELWRFMGIIAVALFHSYLLGFTNYHFMVCGYLYTDFFIILTGFFTTKHFSERCGVDWDLKAKDAIFYTINKFKDCILVAILAICIMAVFGMITDEYNTLWYISRAVKEMTMISNNGASSIGALWYLTALIVVMPVFCCLCQIKAKHFSYILAMLYVVIYVNTFKIEGYVDYPISFLRAMNGLCIGMLIYFVSGLIHEKSDSESGFNMLSKVLLTFIEQGLMLFVLFEAWNNENNIEFVFICMVIGMAIMLSEVTYSSLVKSIICDYLGRLSMVMFIMHMPVAIILHYNEVNSRVIYLLSSILCSIIIEIIIQRIKRRVILMKN